MANALAMKIGGLDVWFDYDRKSHRWIGTIYPKGARPEHFKSKIPGGSGSSLDEAIARTKSLVYNMQTAHRDPSMKKRAKSRSTGDPSMKISSRDPKERRSWLEKGDLVRGPGFSGTGTVLGIAFLNWGKSGHVYHVKDARGVTQAIYASEMKRVRRGTSEPRRPASKSGSDRDPSRDSKKQSLEHAARQWADHRKHYHLSSDYFELDHDARDYLLDLMGQTAWRQSPASKASGRSKLYAFSIALKKLTHLPHSSRDPGRAHHHRKAGAPSFAKQKLISAKIRLLVREGYGPKQAAAIAYRTYGVSRAKRGS